jgi:hypothetical protein
VIEVTALFIAMVCAVATLFLAIVLAVLELVKLWRKSR